MGRPVQTVLSYSAPRVFLEGNYRTQTAETLLAASLLGAAGLLLVSRGPPTSPEGALGIVCLLLCGWCIIAWILGLNRRVRITEDGIEFGREFWDWRDISCVGGVIVGSPGYNPVQLFFNVRRCVPPGHELPITPRLRWHEYVRLMDELRRYLSEHHPDVTVESTDVSWPPADA